MDADNLQVKALADKAKQFTQQKKQLQARQNLAKAQAKMRDASKPII
jgi:phage shock protein A